MKVMINPRYIPDDDLEHRILIRKNIYNKNPVKEINPQTGESTIVPFADIEKQMREKEDNYKFNSYPHAIARRARKLKRLNAGLK